MTTKQEYRKATARLRPLTLVACAALISCGPTSPEPAQHPPAASDEAPTSAAPAAAADRIATLSGEWRVAAIDGRPLDEPVGIAISGDDASVWWEPACAGVVRRYRIEGGSVSFSPVESDDGSKTVCSIGLPPRLADVLRALDEADAIQRTPSNGVLISGPTHDVTLFLQ